MGINTVLASFKPNMDSTLLVLKAALLFFSRITEALSVGKSGNLVV
jgi:hypothetical protein